MEDEFDLFSDFSKVEEVSKKKKIKIKVEKGLLAVILIELVLIIYFLLALFGVVPYF